MPISLNTKSPIPTQLKAGQVWEWNGAKYLCAGGGEHLTLYNLDRDLSVSWSRGLGFGSAAGEFTYVGQVTEITVE